MAATPRSASTTEPTPRHCSPKPSAPAPASPASKSWSRHSKRSSSKRSPRELPASPVEKKSMHNIWLIAKREYLERIRTKAFLIASILIPLFMGAFIFGSGYLASRTKSSAHLAIVSSNAAFAADLKHELQSGKNSSMTIDLLTPTSASSSDETRATLDQN